MNKKGFTLVELMVVIAIIGILAGVTLPSYAAKINQARVENAISFTNFIREDIQDYYSRNNSMPQANGEIGLPAPEQFISNETKQVTIVDGAIHITLGNHVSDNIKGNIVSIRPAVVEGVSRIPISWIVGYASVPEGLTVLGENRTDLDSSYLSYDYRW